MKVHETEWLIEIMMSHYPNLVRGPEDLYERLEPYLEKEKFLLGELSMADIVLAHFYFDHWV